MAYLFFIKVAESNIHRKTCTDHKVYNFIENNSIRLTVRNIDRNQAETPKHVQIVKETLLFELSFHIYLYFLIYISNTTTFHTFICIVVHEKRYDIFSSPCFTPILHAKLLSEYTKFRYQKWSRVNSADRVRFLPPFVNYPIYT